MTLLLPLCSASLIAIVALGIGRRLLGASAELHPTSRLGIAGALGLAVLSLLAFAAGLVGLYRPAPLLALLVVVLLVGWTGICASAGDAAKLLARPRAGARRLLLLWAVAMLGLGLIGALAPPRYNDAVMHHVWFPSRYLAAERLLPISVTEMYAAAYPVGVHALFTLGMALGGDSTPAVIEWLAGCFLLLLVHGETAAAAGSRAAVLVSAGLLASPTFCFLLGAANVDIDFFLLAAASLATLGHRRLALAGLLAGAASGMKPVFGWLPLALGLGVLVLSLAQRRVRQGSLLVFAASGIAAALPQPLWRLATTGNPLYPLFWGGRDLTPEMLERLQPLLAQGRFSVFHLPQGLGVTPLDLCFSNGPFLLALLPLAFLSRTARTRVPLALAAGGLSLAIVLAVLALDRFLILPLAYLAPALGLALEGMLASGRTVAAAVRTLFLVGLGWGLLWSSKLEASNLPHALGVESREAYLERWFHDYPLVRQVRQRMPAGGVLLRLCRFDLRNYYLEREVIDLPALALERGRVHETAASMGALLARHRVTHILDCGNLGNLFVDGAEEAAFRAQMVELLRRDGRTLFELRGP